MCQSTRKFWICECCGSLIVTLPQDDATKYKCPACAIMKCDKGQYEEISIKEFYMKAAISLNKGEK